MAKMGGLVKSSLCGNYGYKKEVVSETVIYNTKACQKIDPVRAVRQGTAMSMAFTYYSMGKRKVETIFVGFNMEGTIC